ncbi:uncharacterized protein LOC134835884 isoform X2 [Culicoides brevitarsis]|uniref:uncharacterized protein LOC134835884 isoform X2 n=1 Tax=Culicoides brevitarsis TaxID=469753 RepID=UPI00307C0710
MNTIERATKIAGSCILPSLKVKLGEQFIDETVFLEFKPILQTNLHILLDIFHSNQHELLTIDINTLQFRKNFIIVLCEQSTQYNIVFQDKDTDIEYTINNLFRNHVNKLCNEDEKLLQKIFEYYQSTLKKENWKYNIGALNSFPIFVNELYGTKSKVILDFEIANFILASGLNFIDHFEPKIQIVGIKLFNILLLQQNAAKLSKYNIHEVILENAEKLIHKFKEVDFEVELWQCLLSCFLFRMEKQTPEIWSKFDDIFEQLLQKLAIESDKSLSILYIHFIIHFSLIGDSELHKINDSLEINSGKDLIKYVKLENIANKQKKLLEIINTCKQECPSTNFRILRWLKKMLCIFQNETLKFGGCGTAVSIHVNELHLLYCISIFTVPAQILGINFATKCRKLIGTLLEAYHLFKLEPFICQAQ